MRPLRTIALLSPIALFLHCGEPMRVVPVAPSSTVESPVRIGWLARAGERFSYHVSIGGIDVAMFTLSVADGVAEAGHQQQGRLLVQSSIVSLGIVTLLKPVEDQFASWLDLSTGRPQLFQSSELESDGRVSTTVELKTRPVPFEVLETNGQHLSEPQVLGPDVLDMNSMMLWLRAWSGVQGQRAVFDVIRSRFVWRVQTELQTRANVTTALGQFPALVLQGVARKLRRDGSEITGDDRHFTFTVTNDAGRVPVALVAKTELGDVRMDLIDYEPGQGAVFSDAK
jgi:Protein of unknown function (DUF3108)